MHESLSHSLQSAKRPARVLVLWLVLAAAVGLVCGGVGTAFHLSVEAVTELRGEHGWILWLLPLAGLVIVALYKGTRCEGMGTNNVIRAVQSGEAVSPLLVPAIFLGTVLTHLGLTFSVAFVPGFLAALVAYGVSLACGISPTRFALADAPALTADAVLKVMVLGAACAVVSRLFCGLLHFTEHELPKRLPNPWVRAAVGGMAVVALSYLMGVDRYNGAGMGVIAAAVEQGEALPWDFLCKALLTAVTLASGFKGGEVVPSFYIGATFGCAVGPLLGLPAGFSAAVGLVAVFCGATNTLIPSILMAYELFQGEGLELVALGCGVCYMLSGYHGLYSSQTFVTEKWASEYHEKK